MSPEFYYDIGFGTLQITSCLVLLVLYVWKRKTRIVKSRLFIPYFILAVNILNACTSILIHVYPAVKCYSDTFLSIPLILSVLLSYCIIVARHLVMQRIEILKVQFFGKNHSMIDFTATVMSDNLYDEVEEKIHEEVNSLPKEETHETSETSETHEPHETHDDIPCLNIQKETHHPTGTTEESIHDSFAVTISQESTESDVMPTDKNIVTDPKRQAHEEDSPKGSVNIELDASRGKKRKQLSLAIFKKISKAWFLILLIVSYFVLYQIIVWITYFAFNAGIEANIEGMCSRIRLIFSSFLAISMVLFIVLLLILLVINGIAFKEEIISCRCRQVFLDNDPFLFTLTTSLLFIFMILTGMSSSIISGVGLSMDSVWGRIPGNLFWALPTTWVICGIPVIYALFQDINMKLIEMKAEQRKQQDLKVKKASNASMKEFLPSPEGIVLILEDKKASKLFEKFSMKEYSVENICVYYRIKKYKNLHRRHKITLAKVEAFEIYQTFIASGSVMETNMTSQTRIKIKEVIDKLKNKEVKILPEDLFNECMTEAIINMCDTYRRFFAWSEFKTFLNESEIV